MSKVNMKRTVENIRANTSVYSPIVEVVVNALQAIESTGRQDGQTTVRVHRADQMEMDGGLSDIRSFEVEDNGVGFNAANRESFDTLYSDSKFAEGGKGFGRFICLKYFDNVRVDSVFSEDGGGGGTVTPAPNSLSTETSLAETRRRGCCPGFPRPGFPPDSPQIRSLWTLDYGLQFLIASGARSDSSRNI